MRSIVNKSSDVIIGYRVLKVGTPYMPTSEAEMNSLISAGFEFADSTEKKHVPVHVGSASQRSAVK